MKTFFYIVYHEVAIFLKTIRGKMIDTVVIVSTSVFVFAYLMPRLGVPKVYGSLILIGLIPVVVFFEMISRIIVFVSDITETKKISYLLTLPIRPKFVFIAIGVGWAACSSILGIFIIPIGKLLFWKGIDLGQFSFFRFFLMFVIVHLFISFFGLWLSGLIKSMKYASWIWARVVNPMFMLGGYFYTWYVIYSASHTLGYINLLNPIIYCMEGIRAAALGGEGFLPFYISFLVVSALTVIFGWIASCLLVRRMDTL